MRCLLSESKSYVTLTSPFIFSLTSFNCKTVLCLFLTTSKTSVNDIIGIVKTDEPTDSVTLKKEAQLSICEKRLIELEKENEQLKGELRNLRRLANEIYMEKTE